MKSHAACASRWLQHVRLELCGIFMQSTAFAHVPNCRVCGFPENRWCRANTSKMNSTVSSIVEEDDIKFKQPMPQVLLWKAKKIHNVTIGSSQGDCRRPPHDKKYNGLLHNTVCCTSAVQTHKVSKPRPATHTLVVSPVAGCIRWLSCQQHARFQPSQSACEKSGLTQRVCTRATIC